MKLSQYSREIKPYIESTCQQIKQQGSVVNKFNQKEYTSIQELLDDCVIEICVLISEDDLEKDISLVEALKEAGIVEGYLTGQSGMLSMFVKGKMNF